MTQGDLARELGVGLRTIGRWERNESVPRSALGALLHVLRLDDGRPDSASDAGPPLREASSAELLEELARRMEGREEDQDATVLTQLPTGRYRMKKSAGPHARADREHEQDQAGTEQTQ